MAEYRFRPRARADIDDIWAYTFRSWGGSQARRYLTAMRGALEEIATNPLLGRSRDEVLKGLRSFPLGKHVVFYLAADYGIDVVRVLHERMDPTAHLPAEKPPGQ